MDFSIVIPMHDEEEALPALLAALDDAYARWAPEMVFEAVLVDDGSRDRTFTLAYTWAETARFPVKVVRLNPREGIGGALRASFDFCAGEYVVTYDADMSYPLEDVPRLMAAAREGADVVTASPFHPRGAVRELSGLRLRVSRAATAVYRARLGRRARGLTCFTCGFRAYRRGILPGIVHRHDGFLATAELLVRALRGGHDVREVPSELAPRVAGRSKMRLVRTALSHLWFLIALR